MSVIPIYSFINNLGREYRFIDIHQAHEDPHVTIYRYLHGRENLDSDLSSGKEKERKG